MLLQKGCSIEHAVTARQVVRGKAFEYVYYFHKTTMPAIYEYVLTRVKHKRPAP